MKPTRLCLWLALCAILGLSITVYTLRTQRARDLRDIEGLAVRAGALERENVTLSDHARSWEARARAAEAENAALKERLRIIESPGYRNALLVKAVEARDEASVKALLAKGADPNTTEGWPSLLAEAAYNGDLKIAELLLRYGANVNPNKSQPPLAWASYSMNALPMMRLLIRAGADVNARFDDGATVITVARFHSGDEAVALLKKAGARR